MPTIILHHLRRSRSHRILWLLEELGLPFELREYHRDPETLRAPRSLRQVHPLGRAPALEIGGTVFVESGAVIETLLDLKEGGLRPEPGTEAFRRYRFYLHFAEGSMMAPLLLSLVMNKIRSTKLPFGIRHIAKTIANKTDDTYTNGELENHRAFLENELKTRRFLTGDTLTGADIQMSYPIEALLSRGKTPSPNIDAYHKRLKERPAYQRALELGGPVLLD